MPHLFVTGCGRGIGAALVEEGLGRGWTVSGTWRGGEDPFGGRVRLNRVEMSDPAAIAEQLHDVDGPIDLLINNAGIYGPEKTAMAAGMDWAGFAQTMVVNAAAPLAVTQALRPKLAAGGKVLTISSQMSYMGYAKPTRIAYRASKAAVNKVFQGAATELAEAGHPVALIDPGWVRTDMGGPEADQDVGPVASGILNVAEALTLEGTGKFYRFTGEERPF